MFAKISELVTPIVGAGGVRKKSEFPKPGEMEIVWKGFGQGRDAVFRTLMGGEGDKVRPLVSRVTDAVSLILGLGFCHHRVGVCADSLCFWDS